MNNPFNVPSNPMLPYDYEHKAWRLREDEYNMLCFQHRFCQFLREFHMEAQRLTLPPVNLYHLLNDGQLKSELMTWHEKDKFLDGVKWVLNLV